MRCLTKGGKMKVVVGPGRGAAGLVAPDLRQPCKALDGVTFAPVIRRGSGSVCPGEEAQWKSRACLWRVTHPPLLGPGWEPTDRGWLVRHIVTHYEKVNFYYEDPSFPSTTCGKGREERPHS